MAERYKGILWDFFYKATTTIHEGETNIQCIAALQADWTNYYSHWLFVSTCLTTYRDILKFGPGTGLMSQSPSQFSGQERNQVK